MKRLTQNTGQYFSIRQWGHSKQRNNHHHNTQNCEQCGTSETTISISYTMRAKTRRQSLVQPQLEVTQIFDAVCVLSNDSESIMGTHLWGYKQMSAGSQIPRSVNEDWLCSRGCKWHIHIRLPPAAEKENTQALFQTKWIQISQVKIMFLYFFKFFLGGSEVQEGWGHHVLWLHSISLEPHLYILVNNKSLITAQIWVSSNFLIL